MACSRRSARPRTRSSASSAPREHEPATAAELQLLRESVEEAARCNAVTEAVGVGVKDAAIGRHWFAEARGEDRAVFEAFASLEMQEGFDLGWVRRRMKRSWKPRGDTGYWQFDRPNIDTQYHLPERFVGQF